MGRENVGDPELGSLMQKIRKENGVTQAQIRSVLGSTITTISSYERGKTSPTVAWFLRWADEAVKINMEQRRRLHMYFVWGGRRLELTHALDQGTTFPEESLSKKSLKKRRNPGDISSRDELGSLMLSIREKNGITAAWLGGQFQTHVNTIRKYEQGKSSPELLWLLRWAEAVHVNHSQRKQLLAYLLW